MRELAIKILRSVFGRFGLEVYRKQPEGTQYNWLRELQIDTVFDIGANTGQFATFIRSVLPEAMIYSFEPLGHCFRQLERNMKLDRRFRSFNLAVGDVTGEAEFFSNSFSPSSSLLPMEELHKKHFPYTARGRKEIVQVVRLDDVASTLKHGQHLLVKIDVQGAEDRVLRGGRYTIRQADAIIIETSFQVLYSGQALFKDIMDFLHEEGFRYMGGFHGHHLLRPIVSRIDGSNLSEDSVFVSERVLAYRNPVRD